MRDVADVLIAVAIALDLKAMGSVFLAHSSKSVKVMSSCAVGPAGANSEGSLSRRALRRYPTFQNQSLENARL